MGLGGGRRPRSFPTADAATPDTTSRKRAVNGLEESLDSTEGRSLFGAYRGHSSTESLLFCFFFFVFFCLFFFGGGFRLEMLIKLANGFMMK